MGQVFTFARFGLVEYCVNQNATPVSVSVSVNRPLIVPLDQAYRTRSTKLYV